MKAILLLLACLVSASSAGAQQSIVFTTESYPPFSYREADGTYRGAGIDQIEIIMRDISMPYRVEMLPWARAILQAESQPMHCVFAAARTPEREARFKWVEPLFVDRSILVRHAGSKVAPTKLEDARRHIVGTHRADYTETLLRSLGFPKVDLSADFGTTLRKLLQERIDLMPMSESVYDKLRAEGTAVEKVIVLSERPLGIACNKGVPDRVISGMQASLNKLIRDGVQNDILRRYGINQPQ